MAEQIVDATRSQMQALAEVQIKAIDHLMDAWEEQLKSPNPTTASPGMLSKLQSPPSISGAGVWPGGAIFSNPLEFWMQFTQQCQKSWMDGMDVWTKFGKPR